MSRIEFGLIWVGSRNIIRKNIVIGILISTNWFPSVMHYSINFLTGHAVSNIDAQKSCMRPFYPLIFFTEYGPRVLAQIYALVAVGIKIRKRIEVHSTRLGAN